MKKISLILALILILVSLGCVPSGIAFAASQTIYTSVTEDLQKDETFDVSEYPSTDKLTDKDKVMDVIQIAESNAGELFLYVYQPQAGKYTATEVRISQTVGDNLAVKDRKLTLLSREGTLEKYKVEELQVKADAVRYYLIVQLAHSNTETSKGDNNIDTVSYPVGKLFTVCTVDGNITYTMEYQELISIRDKRVGYLRYTDTSSFLSMLGYDMVGETLDSHYVAFTTDKPIDKLYEIDISYNTVVCHKDTQLGITTETEEDAKFVSDSYTADNYANVDVMHKSYKWKRIQSANEFISTEPTLSDEAKEKLNGMTWVLRFLETNVTVTRPTQLLVYRTYTRVEQVTILRLKFDLQSKTYNLGVVDNKQSETPNQRPDNEPDNLLDKFRELFAKMESLWDKIAQAFKWLGEHWWVIIVGLAAIALIAGLIIAIVKEGAAVVFKVIGKVLWWIFKIIFYIVTLPVWLIIWGVRAIKKGRDGNG